MHHKNGQVPFVSPKKKQKQKKHGKTEKGSFVGLYESSSENINYTFFWKYRKLNKIYLLLQMVKKKKVKYHNFRMKMS